MEHVFTLKFQLDESDQDIDALLERLGASDCSDALACIGLPGRLALEFTRQSASIKIAMMSALADVKAILPGAQLIESKPDLHSLLN